MAKGDVTVFDEAAYEAFLATYDLSSDTLKLGIVDDTITPAQTQTSPTWSDFSANEVVSTGNYTSGGETLTTVTWAMVSGVPTLGADDVSITMHASGFVDGHWGILYDSTAASGNALAFVQLHDDGTPASEQADDVDVEWTGGEVLQFLANPALAA